MQSQHTIWSLDDRFIIINYIHGSYSFWNEWGSIIIKSRTLCQVDLIFIRLIHSTRNSSSIILSTTQWIHPLIIFARQRRATNDPAHCPQSIDLFAARYNTQRATGSDRRRPGVIELYFAVYLCRGALIIFMYIATALRSWSSLYTLYSTLHTCLDLVYWILQLYTCTFVDQIQNTTKN